jgi:tRNA threonylcarbamoyladenosine biosynthesis protein TsaB
MMEPAGEECVTNPSDVPLPAGEGWVGAGPGWAAYEAALAKRCGMRVRKILPSALPSARAIAELAAAAVNAGHAIKPELAIPVYLRDNVAVKVAKP